MKRLIFVVGTFTIRGGLESILFWLAKELKSQFEIHVVCELIDEEMAGVQYHLIELPKQMPFFMKSLKFSKLAQKKVDQLKNEMEIYAVINTGGTEIPRVDYAIMASCHKEYFIRELNRSKIFSVNWFKKKFNPVHRVILYNQKRVLKNITKDIFPVSYTTGEEFHKYYNFPRNRIKPLYPPINTEDFLISNVEIKRESVLKSLGIPPDSKLVFFIANEIFRKGLVSLMKAFHELNREDIYLLIQESPRLDKNHISRIAKENKLVNKVFWVKKELSSKEMSYAISDIMILPTLYESFGIVVAESILAGTPVMFSKLAPAVELFDGVSLELVLDNPENINEIKNRLEFFFHNEEKYNHDALRLRKKFQNILSPSNIANQFKSYILKK